MTPDADLVRRCLEGDRAAWSDLLSRYADLVHGILHRLGLDAASCADGFQEVCVLLWRHLRRVREAERLAPWIVTTTKRTGWRMKKRLRAHEAREASVARTDVDPGDAPDLALAALEEEQTVREGLAVLGERCRRLLAALYFTPGGSSYDDVAERLGIPRGSIGPTRQRCLEALRLELEARGFRPPKVSGAPRRASPPVERPSGRGRQEPE